MIQKEVQGTKLLIKMSLTGITPQQFCLEPWELFKESAPEWIPCFAHPGNRLQAKQNNKALTSVPGALIIKLLFTGFASSLFLSFGNLQSINLMRSKQNQFNLLYSKNHFTLYCIFCSVYVHIFFIARFLLYGFECWF